MGLHESALARRSPPSLVCYTRGNDTRMDHANRMFGTLNLSGRRRSRPRKVRGVPLSTASTRRRRVIRRAATNSECRWSLRRGYPGVIAAWNPRSIPRSARSPTTPGPRSRHRRRLLRAGQALGTRAEVAKVGVTAFAAQTRGNHAPGRLVPRIPDLPARERRSGHAVHPRSRGSRRSSVPN